MASRVPIRRSNLSYVTGENGLGIDESDPALLTMLNEGLAAGAGVELDLTAGAIAA